MILRKIIKVIYKIVFNGNYLIKNDIPVLYSVIFKRKSFVKELASKEIEFVKPYCWRTWHLGYEYYTGLYNGKKVFIKFNKNFEWIRYECKNFEYIFEASIFLSGRLPKLYSFQKYRTGAYIIEDFLPYKSIERNTNFSNENKKIIINELYEIVKEFQRIKFMHLDLHPKNLFLSDKNKIYIIDLGFSNLKQGNLSFMGNEHRKKQIISNLNQETRLDIGVINDAYSMLQVAKYVDPNLITDDYEVWRKFILLAEGENYNGNVVL